MLAKAPGLLLLLASLAWTPAQFAADLCTDLVLARQELRAAEAAAAAAPDAATLRIAVADRQAQFDAAHAAAIKAAQEQARAAKVVARFETAEAEVKQLKLNRERPAQTVQEWTDAPEYRLYNQALAAKRAIWTATSVRQVRSAIAAARNGLQIDAPTIEAVWGAGGNIGDTEDLRVERALHISDEATVAAIDRLLRLRADLTRAVAAEKANAGIGFDIDNQIASLHSTFVRRSGEAAAAQAELDRLNQEIQSKTAIAESPVRQLAELKLQATDSELKLARSNEAAAKAELDRAKAELAAAESGSASSSDVAAAQQRIKDLESYLESLVASPVEATLRLVIEAEASTDRETCRKKITQADAVFQEAIRLHNSHSLCLTDAMTQRVMQTKSRARATQASCESLSTTTSESRGGFTPTGRSGDIDANPTSADPTNAHVQGVDAAIQACDFDRALASLNLYRPADPGDPWMAAKYQEIHEKRRRVAEIQNLMDQVRTILRGGPSQDDLRYAASLMRAASSPDLAVGCMSGSISSLTPVIDGAMTAARDADRRRAQEAAGRLADALSDVIDNMNRRSGATTASNGGGPPPPLPQQRGSDEGFTSNSSGSSQTGSQGGGFTPTGSNGGASSQTQSSGNQQSSSRSSGNSTISCNWFEVGTVLGQSSLGVGPTYECRCGGAKVSDSRCSDKPKPR